MKASPRPLLELVVTQGAVSHRVKALEAGAKPPEGAYVITARIAAAYYFAHFLILMPLIGGR